MKLKLFGFTLLLALSSNHSPAQNRSENTQQLLKNDSLFAATSLKAGAKEAFRQFLLPNSLQLPDKAEPVHGLNSIIDSFGNYDDDFILEWNPQEGETSQDNTMGWTWGVYYVKSKKDSSIIRKGKYLNVWGKDEDNNWKVKVDMGNSTPLEK